MAIRRVLALVTLGVAIALFGAAAGPAADPADSISYAYDELGRLTAVIDPAAPTNGVARYTYDEVGNITSIERLSSAGVSVVQLTPAQGAIGSSVVVYGTGFSAAPSSNTVSFGGANATVTQATKTQLRVTVPAGAVTGTVTVTSPNGSASSSSPFTVVAAPDPPSISGFTPAVAGYGATVTVNGNRFSATPADNAAAINRMRSAVATATDSTLTFNVPTGATSGRILVATPDGQTTSAADLFVPPRGFTAADVLSTGRMAIGDLNRSFSVSDPAKIGLLVFDGTAGQYVFLNIPSSTMWASLKVYDPLGLELGATAVASGSGYVDTIKLPTTGTYTILVDPMNNTSGSVTLSLYDAAPSTGTIQANGQAQTITGLTTGQNAIRTFSGTAGQRVFLKIDSQISTIIVRLRDPDGILLSSISLGSGSGSIDTQTLSKAGTHTIEVDPNGAATGNVTLTLYDVPADSTGTITPGGAAQTVTLSTPGQNGTRTFSGTTGQRISLKLSSNSIGTGCCSTKVSIKNPDGSNLVAPTFVATSGGFIDTQTLGATGTYTILVDPQDSATGSITLTLYDVPADDTGTITIGGGTVTMTLSTPGQNGTRTFSGTTGQALTLTLSSVTIGTSTCCSAKLSVKNPDGSNLVAPTFFGTSGKTQTMTLTATGTHTILIDPQDAATGSVTMNLTTGGGGAFRLPRPNGTELLAANRYRPARLARHAIPDLELRRLDEDRFERRLNAAEGTAARKPKHATKASPQTEDQRALHQSASHKAGSTARSPQDAVARGPRGTLPDYRPGSMEEWIPPSAEPSTWFSGRPESPYESLPALTADSGVTAIAGRVLRLDGLPLADVTVRGAGRVVTTDLSGRFLLEHVHSGHVVLTVDARTANRPGTTYGVYEMGTIAAKGKTNVLPFTIWSPKLDTQHEIKLDYPLERDVVLTTPLIPNLEIHIPAGSEVHDRQGRLIRHLGITPLPLDRSPFPMPGRFPVYFTVQPGAAYVWPHGVEVVYPNKMHAPPNRRVEFYSYDPQQKGWHVYGKGTVTEDGKQVRFDPGTRQYELTSSGICLGCTLPAPIDWIRDFIVAGDPVAVASGAFVFAHTDLVEHGTPQIDVSRVYRSSDTTSHAFGIGNSMTYNMSLYQPVAHTYDWADLVFANGSRVHYTRISPGTGYNDMVLEAQTTPSSFYKSKIVWNGSAWELRRVDGSVYVFANGGYLQSIRDRFGNEVAIFTGSVLGDIIQIYASSGRWLKFTNGIGNRTSQIEDQSGRAVSYTYDGSGHLTQSTDVRGNATTYTYDASGRMATIRDPRNNVRIQNHYDTNGRIDSQTLPGSATYSFAYTTDGNGNITQADVTNPRNYVRRLTFNSSGYPLTDTWARATPREQQTTYEYETGTNRLLAETDARSRRTEYEYNAFGKLTKVTRLAGTSGAVSTNFTYEPNYQLLASAADPLGHGPSFTYDSKGALATITDARGKQTTLTSNTAGQPLSVTDPLTNSTSFAYTLGDLTSVTDPLNAVAKRFVDAAGRPTRITDPLSRTTRYSWDPGDGLTGITDAANRTTTLTRDANGNVTKVTDARNHESNFIYDASDRLTSRQDALLKTESYEYDLNDNPIKFTDRKGQVTSLGYDELDRLTFTGYGTTGAPPTYSSTLDYTYDNGNRLTSAVDSVNGTITESYDDLDRLTSETTSNGTISYSYDNADRRQTMTVTGQPAVSYAYNNADDLTTLTRGTLSASIAYDDADRPQSVTLPDGIVQSYGYDTASNLIGLTYQNGQTTLGDLVYGYDSNGLRTSVGGSYARTSLPAAVATATYDANNRLTSWNGATQTYDDNGNLTGDGTKTYTWNARDELVSLSGGTSASFAYDAFGRRRSLTLNGTQTKFLSDEDNVAQELDSAGAVRANLVSGLGLDELFATIAADGTVTTVLSDALGSTIALANAAATVHTSYTYDPFGAATQSGTGSLSYQFTGRDNDQTGLQYNRARYHNPSTGRFISEDPLRLGGGDINLYAYTSNSPTNATDPAGMESIAYPSPRATNWEPIAAKVKLWAPRAARAAKWLAPRAAGGGILTVVAFKALNIMLSSGESEPDPSRPPDRSAPAPNEEGAPYGTTPKGRPYTKHYGTETGPERNIPGSVVDEVIDTYPGRAAGGGKTVHYDPNNDVTVVTGDDGAIVSVRRGPPRSGQR